MALPLQDEEVYQSNGNFKEFCKEHHLPFNVLKTSYQNNGTKLYQTNRALSATSKENLKFKGWYALSNN